MICSIPHSVSVHTHTHTHFRNSCPQSEEYFFFNSWIRVWFITKGNTFGLHSLLAYVKNCCMFLFRRIFCPLLQYIQKKIAVLLCEQKACIWQNLALKTIAEHMEPLQCIWSFHQEGGIGRVRRTDCEEDLALTGKRGSW